MDKLIKDLKKQFKLKKKEVFELKSLAEWLFSNKGRYAFAIEDYLKNNSFFFLKEIFDDAMDFLSDSTIPFYNVCILVRAVIKNIILKEGN